MNLIGILGEAGSGKDTAGRLLVQEHRYYGLALADPIKLFCMWVFGWDPQLLWGPSELRDKVDESLPFICCPECGYFSPRMTEEFELGGRNCFICHKTTPDDSWIRGLSPRFALQHLGTDWCHPLNKQGQVDMGVRRAKSVMYGGIEFDPLYSVLPDFVKEARYVGQRHPKGVYISDVRFRHEIPAIREGGGEVHRIRRRGKADNTTTGIPGHSSEAEQRGIPDEELDGIIENHGTLDALHTCIRRLAART